MRSPAMFYSFYEQLVACAFARPPDRVVGPRSDTAGAALRKHDAQFTHILGLSHITGIHPQMGG